jgi:hypothetical protein
MLMSPGGKLAKLHYLPNQFRVLVRGDFVLCAKSGERIPLETLRYWSVERQEPYASAQAATEAVAG